MAKFVFKLQGVLRQRKHVEQQCQREVATRQAALSELDARLRGVNQTANDALDDLRKNRLIGKIDLDFLASHRRFMLAMQRQVMGLAQNIAVAQRAVDEARVLLGEAAKARKVIEKLRDKQFQRWREALAKKETAELDEVGMRIGYENLLKSDMGV
jgi:flagellar protein FliJ